MNYFTEEQGKVFAILNSRQRTKESDVIATVPLDTKKLRTYKELKEAGKEDSIIFETLFPAESAKNSMYKITIDINHLNKSQLTHLISQEMGTTLNSLINMTSQDLRKLLVTIKDIKQNAILGSFSQQ